MRGGTGQKKGSVLICAPHRSSVCPLGAGPEVTEAGGAPVPKRPSGLWGRVIGWVAFAFALGGIGYAELGAPARAAVVTYDAGLLEFSAHAGEVNAVTVQYAPGEATITDSGAPLEAGTGCEQIDVSTARCPFATDVFVLGDGADTIRVVGAPPYVEFFVYAGTGSDTVRAGAFTVPNAGLSVVRSGGGNDTILDGPSDSFLDGGKGDDTVRGGPGQDDITGRAGNDALYGGRGWDLLEYDLAPRGVIVNLATGTARGWGRDTLRGFESVFGSETFADVLIGDNGPNFLAGFGGRDQIHGRRGRDDLDGGWGNDVLFARDGSRDNVYGGRGSDRACIDRRIDRVFSTGLFSCRL